MGFIMHKNEAINDIAIKITVSLCIFSVFCAFWGFFLHHSFTVEIETGLRRGIRE